MRGIRIVLHLSTGEPIELLVDDILYYSRSNLLEGDSYGSLVYLKDGKLLVTELPGQIYYLIHFPR